MNYWTFKFWKEGGRIDNFAKQKNKKKKQSHPIKLWTDAPGTSGRSGEGHNQVINLTHKITRPSHLTCVKYYIVIMWLKTPTGGEFLP